MTTITSGTLGQTTDTALEAVRPAGKASDSARFREDRRNPAQNIRHPRPLLQVELVCREGTKPHDPFWDGPRLVPVFVTQLLGQVLHPAEPMLRPLAYCAKAPVARVLDTRL